MGDQLDIEFEKMSIADRGKTSSSEEVITISDSSSSTSRASSDTCSVIDLPSSHSKYDIEPLSSHSIKSSEHVLANKLTFDDFDDDDDEFAIAVPFFASKNKSENPNSSVFNLEKYIQSVDKKFGVLDVTQKKHKVQPQPIKEIAKPVIDLSQDSINIDLEEDFLSTREKIQLLPITDPRLEELDPNPEIHKLFTEFDRRFFDGLLTQMNIQCKWAKNLTSTAGAYYRQKKTIKLSALLIQQRPRSDLVNTLLHEMIHAYVHQKSLPDRRSHGRFFMEQMNRINESAGTQITIYHSWRTEVKALKKYHWRCTGDICQAYGPTRGIISLPIQRRPNRFDYSYRFHEKYQCVGQFESISDNFTSTTIS